jgi:aryl-alcohol dehydrogenase-like predicted oxidoreductase
MEMIKIPHTDLEVSRLAMGCMGLGDGWGSGTQLTADHERQAREFLDAAEEIGVNFFDHANIYGRGRSEEVFGRVLKERPSLRDKIVIQSKCGIRWAADPPRITATLRFQPRTHPGKRRRDPEAPGH